MKKVSLEQLYKESGEEVYSEQYRYICRRIEARELIPVKKSPLNGKKPALHLSYWIAEEAPDYAEEVEELKYRMVPAIRTDYYMKHLDVYREEAVWVRLLNRYFLEQGQPGGGKLREPEPVSLNERSFQIWGREKFLQREQGRRILAHCGVELGQLHVYGTTEPLAYYSCSRNVPQKVLILENKDTFYSMRRYLGREGQGKGQSGRIGNVEQKEANDCAYKYNVGVQSCNADEQGCKMGAQGCNANEQGCNASAKGCNTNEQGCTGDSAAGLPGRIFGVEIATVIYGAGKGILRSFEDFRFCVEAHVNDPGNEILYFGDLDYEGIGIYERLAALFGSGGGGCEIKPFVQAYGIMLQKARARGLDFLPESSEKQNQNLSGLFFSYFPESLRDGMGAVLESGKYIPQEIINISDFINIY